MVYEAAPELVSFDAGEALATVEAVAGDGVLAVAELTSRDYNVLYLSDAVQRRYEDAEVDVETVATDLHSYESVDFLERRMIDDLLPQAETVSAFTTFTDLGVMARVIDDDEGLYVAVERGVDVSGLVDALEPVVRGA